MQYQFFFIFLLMCIPLQAMQNTDVAQPQTPKWISQLPPVIKRSVTCSNFHNNEELDKLQNTLEILARWSVKARIENTKIQLQRSWESQAPENLQS
jgi:hypothetical protein